MAMDYFVWALTNGSETVVVDLGFTEAVGTARGRQFLRAHRQRPRRGRHGLRPRCSMWS